MTRIIGRKLIGNALFDGEPMEYNISLSDV